MLIAYCEECGHQYKLDAGKIPGKSAKVKCRTCNHVFTVHKEPGPGRPRPQDTALFRTIVESDWKTEAPVEELPGRTHGPAPSLLQMKGVGLTTRMLLTFLVLIAATGCALLSVYFWIVPDLMRRQIQLRSESIAKTFAVSVMDPVLVRNFLRVNQAAEKASQLPGVAYVAVLNPKDIVVAGIVGNAERYSSPFLEEIRSKGFPKDLVLQNKLTENRPDQVRSLVVDGQKVMDLAVPVGDTRWEAHIGVFTSDVDQAMERTLLPVLITLGVMAIVGAGVFAILARTVSGPIKELCAAAMLISQGQLNQKIEIRANGEIGQLALAIEAMRLSIFQAIERLRKPKPYRQQGASDAHLNAS
jgi:predicted Zn finger-like uncharacterized protein